MGLGLWSSSKSKKESQDSGPIEFNDLKTAIEGDPDKYNFKIKDEFYRNNLVLVTINYPTCNNYGGDKALIYREEDWLKIKDGDKIDPHFLEDEVSPLARFRPTPEGIEIAMQTMNSFNVNT